VFFWPPGSKWGDASRLCGRPVVRMIDDLRTIINKGS
jgi:hypothetical protein